MKYARVIGIILVLAAAGFGAFFIGAGGLSSGPGGRTSSTAQIQASAATTELVKGKNRLVLGLLDSDNKQVREAKVELDIKRLDGDGDEIRTRARYVGEDFGGKGVYVADVDFSHPGQWQADVRITAAGYGTRTSMVDLPVLSEGETPAVGEDAPRSVTPVARTEGRERDLCSADPPCSMHDHSVAESIAAHRPVLVLFAAPARCVSQLCGPQLGIVEEAKKLFSEKVDFVHVEIYEGDTDNPVDAVVEWGLPSEPFIFLVDAEGKVAARFEGPVTLPELRKSINAMLAESSGAGR